MSIEPEEDPVIILTPGSETINLDPLPGLNPQPGAAPATTPSASASMSQTAGNAVLEAVKISLVSWKDDRFKTVRPFGEFLDRSKLSLPKPSEILTRMKNNLSFYQTNYIIVFFILSVYSAYATHLFALTSSALPAQPFYFHSLPLVAFGFGLSSVIILSPFVLVVLFTFCSIPYYLLYLLHYNSFNLVDDSDFVIGHSLFMTPQAVDEFGFGVLPPLGQPEAHFAQIPSI